VTPRRSGSTWPAGRCTALHSLCGLNPSPSTAGLLADGLLAGAAAKDISARRGAAGVDFASGRSCSR
jgi:hypothetical protein